MGYVRILFLDVTAWSSDWRLKFGGPEFKSRPYRYRAFHKLLGNFLATSCISSNFFRFEQLICILNNFSSYFLILTYRSSFLCLNWFFFHISQCFSTQFMNFLLKKRGQILPPGADHGRQIEVAGLGWRFLEKIQNCGRRFSLDWLECLGWRKSFNNLYSVFIFSNML